MLADAAVVHARHLPRQIEMALDQRGAILVHCPTIPQARAAGLWSARMATFTRLDDADAAAIASAMQLGRVTGWAPIAAGTINSNFTFDTERGRWFVRVNEGKREDDV